ncbi:MAG TPA: hypothetical protein VFR67_01630 [Pilimelia sp.]|nr:hypothetical protein [Pilimelia sp.]
MTTRRELLRLAGAAAGAAALGGVAACEKTVTARPPTVVNERLIVETANGLTVVGAGQPTIPVGPAVLDAGRARLVRASTHADHTDVVTHDVTTGRAVSRTGVRGALQPRVLSEGGHLVALATPGGPSPYRPAGRSRTTLVVADASGERVRLDLPGNLEPEAFTAAGQGLFVLEYLPPAAPDRYRVRLVDLAKGTVQPLLTRLKQPVPRGAEEEMRGEGRQAVYHPSLQMLFTLYTHQPDHLHTRDRLAGARRNAPEVHAFVHSLNLLEQWAFCIDLPEPFGKHAPAGHAIALRPDGSGLAVVETTTGTVAYIDPQMLTITDVRRFAPPAGAGGTATASAAYADRGRLVVGAGREVVVVTPAAGDTDPRWSCAAPVRGLAVHARSGRVYVGQPDSVVCHALDTGRVLARVPAAGLVALRDAIEP